MLCSLLLTQVSLCSSCLTVLLLQAVTFNLNFNTIFDMDFLETCLVSVKKYNAHYVVQI